jgi:hypothetical protein
MKLTYDNLHHLQVGRIGEYWIKLMLTSYGLDTYYSDVDNKAIDFVVRLGNSKHIDIQVKTIRLKGSSYVFITKGSSEEKTWSNTDIKRENLYLALVLLAENNYPEAYLIPSNVWLKPEGIFSNKMYQDRGLKSKDEWGLSISKKNLHLLEPYYISKQVENILESSHL